MENDLISRVAVLKLIEDIKCNPEVPKNYGTLLDIMRAVRKIPVSYDVDKVVERMNDLTEPTEEYRHKFCGTVTDKRCANYENCEECIAEQIAKIVKSGGID